MGITMWFQMKLNPTPPDPTQKMIFDWMPLIFTFMLAGFPAGLVIYWAWNNLLSVLQQGYIMKKNGAKIELFDNLKSTFAARRKRPDVIALQAPGALPGVFLSGCLRMTDTSDAELIEAGRKIFAGDWQFIWASPSIETLPPMKGVEVAFAGRSNVGKSSLINALTGRNGLARTSHTPGRTQELIFFDGPTPADGKDAGLRLVDMPGYGYASAPKSQIASWTALIHTFLQGRANLARVYVLIDARHGFKDVDNDVLKTLDRSAVSYQVVLTKADQVKKSELENTIAATRRRWQNIRQLFPRCW
jgi:GTP-binding protein